MATDQSLPPVTLPPAAAPAWRAYCAMLASKDAHFQALEAVSAKVKEGGRRSLAETAHLAQLLESHDACVAAFAAAMRELATVDPDANSALLGAITELNRELGGPEPAS